MSQILENVKHLNNFPDTTEALFLKKGVIDKDTFDCYFRSKKKDFNLMVIGQIISIMGAALLRFALSLYVLDITGRADVYAILFAISSIPLLLSPVGGAIADRFNRRNLMVIFDFSSSFIVFCFMLTFEFTRASIPVIGLVMIVLAIISAMYQPAVQASIPLLVKEQDLEKANGIVSGVGALASLAAPICGGILYGIIGIRLLIILSCIAFFLSAIMEIFINIPYTKRLAKGNIFLIIFWDMKEGFHYVMKQKYIQKSMFLASLLNLILTPFFMVGGPIILRVTMGSDEVMYGIGMGLIQVSTILGALSIGFIARKMSMKSIYLWLLGITILIMPMALSITPAILGLGYYPSFIVFFVCVIPIAMAMTIISIYVVTVVQKRVPNEFLGKIMAIITAVAQCAAPVGQVIYGVLLEKFSGQVYLPAIFMCCAMMVTTVLTKFMFQRE